MFDQALWMFISMRKLGQSTPWHSNKPLSIPKKISGPLPACKLGCLVNFVRLRCLPKQFKPNEFWCSVMHFRCYKLYLWSLILIDKFQHGNGDLIKTAFVLKVTESESKFVVRSSPGLQFTVNNLGNVSWNFLSR